MKRRHVPSTVAVFGRHQQQARCSCGWFGLPRTGTGADVLAGFDGERHLEHMAVAR